MISLDNISKSYGSQVLFEDISFKINSRERVGLVGRNGHGKTTLLRIITGEEVPDSGAVTIPKLYRMGYVSQHLHFTKDTVLEEGMLGLPEHESDHHWKVEKILAGLGFSPEDMERHPKEFSGGYQVRLNLAKALISEPDLLLLDEPTNYLDITSIRWVRSFLKTWPHELLLITHDRGFMDQVATHTVGIHRRKARKIPGNTEKFYAQMAQEEEIHEKTRQNDERRQKEIELFITRFRAKARLANLVQSRKKALDKMEKKNKLEEVRNLDFSFRSKPFPGKQVVNAEGITFSYEGSDPLIRDFNMNIRAGDRICVIGKNGKGKTTLLKLFAEVLSPNKGEITYNPNVAKGFYEQTNIKTLVDTRTVEEEILYSDSGVDNQMARNICGAMMFPGDSAMKKVSVLSGGEKSRVMLGKILATQLNVLLLDEPTNHLDMESCDALLAALDHFNGVVIMVTHNEMFLHALAKRLIVFQNDAVTVFEGNYSYFLEKGGWEEEGAGPVEETPACAPPSKMSKKEMRKKRSEVITQKSKALKPLEKKINKTERGIEGKEEILSELNLAMQKASEEQDGKKIKELSVSIHGAQSAIDSLFEELETLTDEYDEKSALFQERLDELDKMGDD